MESLCKQYRNTDGARCEAISDIHLTLQDHRVYALVGESGCGKSTLSRLLSGLEMPSSGQITLDGAPISRRGRKNRQRMAKAIQLVLQDGKSAIDPHFTVYRTIAEPIRAVSPLPREEEQAKVFELLERMELPRTVAARKAAQLSGGQQKRVGIARALAISPRYIIFDESISGLDVIVRKRILDLLKSIQRDEKCGYLFITHEIDAALYLADEVCVMQDGRLIEHKTWKGDLDVFEHPYTRRLLQASHLL